MQDTVKLVADDSQYQATMARAGAAADRFSGRVHQAGGGLEALFKRSPHMRAERALSGFLERAVSGDMVGALTSITGKMSGLGLAAGVAVGAGVAIFQHFKEQIDKTREAHEALQMEMLKKPIGTVTSLSSEGMEQALQTREKLTDDLREKSKSTFGSELFEAGKSMLTGPTLGALGGKDNGKERLEVQKDINKSIAEGKEIMKAQAQAAMANLAIKRTELLGDEKGAAIAKLTLASSQARAALKTKGLTKEAFDRQERAIDDNADTELAQINKKAAQKDLQPTMEEKLAKLQKKGLAGDDLKRVRASMEIEDLDKQIAAEKAPFLKRPLELQRLQKVNEAHALGKGPAAPSNPFPLGTAASRGFESKFGQGGLERRGIEDSLGSGGLARASLDRGESLTPEDALLKSGTSANQIADFRKNVGGLPGEKAAGDSAVVAAVEKGNALIEKYWGG